MMQHNCFQHHQISILERLISEGMWHWRLD